MEGHSSHVAPGPPPLRRKRRGPARVCCCAQMAPESLPALPHAVRPELFGLLDCGPSFSPLSALRPFTQAVLLAGSSSPRLHKGLSSHQHSTVVLKALTCCRPHSSAPFHIFLCDPTLLFADLRVTCHVWLLLWWFGWMPLSSTHPRPLTCEDREKTRPGSKCVLHPSQCLQLDK